MKFLRKSMLALVMAALTTHVHAGDGAWTSSGPFGGRIYSTSIDPLNPARIWVITSGGLFRTLDGGQSWQLAQNGLPSPNTRAPLVVDRANTDRLFAFDNTGRLYRSINGGDDWTVTATQIEINSYIGGAADLPDSLGNFLLATFPVETPDTGRRYLLTVSNNGDTVTPVASALPGLGFYSVEVDASNPLVILAGVDNQSAQAIAAPNVSIYRSIDGGATFSPTISALDAGIYGVTRFSFGAGSRVYSLGSFAPPFSTTTTRFPYRSDDDGATWVAADTPPTNPLSRGEFVLAHPTIADTVYIGASNGLRISTNAGEDFVASDSGLNGNPTYLSTVTSLPLPAYVRWIAVEPGFPAPGTGLWAATEGAGMFRSINGTNWSDVGVNDGLAAVNIRAVAVHPNPSQRSGGRGLRVYSGFGDTRFSTPGIFSSTNGGDTWGRLQNQLRGTGIRSITIDQTTAGITSGAVATTHIYAAGSGGIGNGFFNCGIYKSTNGGSTWANLCGTPTTLNALGTIRHVVLDPRSCGSPPFPTTGPACFGGPLKRVYATATGGPQVANPGNPNEVIHLNRLIRSDDGGSTWTDISGGLPPMGYENTNGAYQFGPTPIYLALDPNDSNVLYLSTFENAYDYDPNDSVAPPDVNTGMFKSIDAGQTWTAINTGLPRKPGFSNVVHSILAMAIHPDPTDSLASNTLWIATIDLATENSAAIYKTTNGGTSWSRSDTGFTAPTDVRALVIDNGNPLDNIINPGDPNVLYAAGAGFASNPGGVFKTINGGDTWLSISRGLPADSVTALAIDPHNPSILHAGTNSGVWSLTQVPDSDNDGVPDSEENNVVNGDGNGDGTQDAAQKEVGSTGVIFRTPFVAQNTGQSTSEIQTALSTPSVSGGCTQALDVQRPNAIQFGRDYIPGTLRYFTYPRELTRFEIADCQRAIVDVTFHLSDFGAQYGWNYRYYGPSIPGDDSTIGWHNFGSRALLLPSAGAGQPRNTWRLTIDANQFGSYRPTNDTILFIGGPSCLDDRMHRDGFETAPATGLPTCN